MAGGENARIIPCMSCFCSTGELVPAERTEEGLETDVYRCPKGHEILVDWSEAEIPDKPAWPPSEQWLAENEPFKGPGK